MVELNKDKERLYEKWRNRWDSFLSDINEAGRVDDAQERLVERLRDKVTIGNAERRIGGGHEGREILELLQNARDAIRDGDQGQGRVYVGVSDQGIIVANTGSRFDFFDKDVEKSVTMIGESGKGEQGYIGHKGVGLKSILATGDSFDIFTRPEPDEKNVLGVRLSRAYPLSVILAGLTQENMPRELIAACDDEKLGEIFQQYSQLDQRGISIEGDLSDSLSKFPLFNFPVPLNAENPRCRPLAKKALSLLTQPEPYRTAVIVWYEDVSWRSILSEHSIPLPENNRSMESDAERLWRYLAKLASADGLQSETILQLGRIRELSFERLHGQEVGQSERWAVQRAGQQSGTHAPIHHEKATVEITSLPEAETFDVFGFEPARQFETQLLVKRNCKQGGGQFPASYPFYLYYPIANTAKPGLPFCLHGKFRVETNRKDLSLNNLQKNQDVLKEACDLIVAVATEVAGNKHGNKYEALYPWVLLPPVPEKEVENPTTQPELIEWFLGRVYDGLSKAAIVPITPEGKQAVQPGKTLLHWDTDVLAGYRALLSITDVATPPSGVLLMPLPALSALEGYTAFPSSWRRRLRHLLGPVNSEQEYTAEILKGWAGTLAAYLPAQDEPGAKVVGAEAARSVFKATTSLIVGSETETSTIPDLLSDLSSQFKDTLLLPCQLHDSNDDSQLMLVKIEPRQTPQGGQAKKEVSRSVIWDVRSQAEKTRMPPVPPEESNFDVFFLDEEVEGDENSRMVLDLAGRAWGVRGYEGIPSLYRSLLDTFASGRQKIIERTDLAFLVALTPQIGDQSEDLQSGEGSFLPRRFLAKALEQGDGDQRQRLRRRIQLRHCGVAFNSDLLVISESVLGDEWQAMLGEDEDDPLVCPAALPDGVSEWPPPGDEFWQSIRRKADGYQIESATEVTNQHLARTLSVLGASAIPGVEIIWTHGEDHPGMEHPPSWNPLEWPMDGSKGSAKLESLRDILCEDEGDYLEWIKSPGYHPADSANHSAKCSVKQDRLFDETNVAVWTWFEDTRPIENMGPAIISALRRHGEALLESILFSGWTCTYGHGRRAWKRPIPSLLNWQLRHLPIWGSEVSTHETLEDQWGNDVKTLAYTVIKEEEKGPQASRLFPRVNLQNPHVPPKSVLEALGVKRVDELNLTQALFRLQKLLKVLSDDKLAHGPTPLNIPPHRDNDWNRAYTQLLRPLLHRLTDDPDSVSDPKNWPFLSHLPLIQDATWKAASVDWIYRNRSEIRYYGEISPKPWEKQKVERKGFYLLPRPSEGKFTELTRLLEIKSVQAEKPIFNPGDLHFVGRDDSCLDQIKEHLLERRALLVASTERTRENQIRRIDEELSYAIEGLEVAEEFPEEASRQLCDPHSGLYQAEEGDALVLDRSKWNNNQPEAHYLAMGLALLVERPSKVATFREALREEDSLQELERRWELQAFPLQRVKRVLGTRAAEVLRRRLGAFGQLCERVGVNVSLPSDQPNTPSVGPEEGCEEEVLQAIRRVFRGNFDQEQSMSPSQRAMLEDLRGAYTELPDQMRFAAKLLFQVSDTSWQREIASRSLSADSEKELIEWLQETTDEGLLASSPYPRYAKEIAQRLLAVCRAWKNTERKQLAEEEGWQEQVDNFIERKRPDWAIELPLSLVAESNRIFFLADDELLEESLSSLRQRLADELPEGVLNQVFPSLRAYIKDGTPIYEQRIQRVDFQQEAFKEIQQFFSNGGDVEEPAWESWREDEVSHGNQLTVATGSSGDGGGSRQMTGRGQQGEVYMMGIVLHRLDSWLKVSPADRVETLLDGFTRLYEQQKDTDYRWHLEQKWEGGLLDRVEDLRDSNADRLLNWRDQLQKGVQLQDLPVIDLINVTQERGPGFDVIDPFGPLRGGVSAPELDFTPIEVKAVSGTDAPFQFRLTINEYRQAKAFLRGGDTKFVVRFVAVPQTQQRGWWDECTIAEEIVFRSCDELEELMRDQQFENAVKGGYMNLNYGKRS